MADFQTTDYIRIDGSISGGNFTVSSITGDALFTTTVFDDDNSGTVTSGDYWAITEYMYSGFTVNVNGNDYALFESTAFPGRFYLPHNGEISWTDLGVTGVGQTFPVTSDSNANVINCFTGDALIRTSDGEIRIDRLAIGDKVLTAEGRAVTVRWIGRQRLSPAMLSRRAGLVRIKAGALGQGQPHSDLTMTGEHGVILDGLVVNAAVLVNGSGIDWVPDAELAQGITVYHLETTGHDVILANGMPAESFVDYQGRAAFENHREYRDLYGAERIIPEMPLPRVSTRRMLPDRIRARLGLVARHEAFSRSA